MKTETSRRRCKSRRPLVLVVDDVDIVRVSIGLVLREMAGFRAVGAATSEEALDLARRRKFDVVTSDINRSGMNGLKFLKLFKRAHPTTPVVVVSAVLDEANTRLAKRLRAFGCLLKPFGSRELVELVQAAMAATRARARDSSTEPTPPLRGLIR